MGRRRGIPSGICEMQHRQAYDGVSAFCTSCVRVKTPFRRFPRTCQCGTGHVSLCRGQFSEKSQNKVVRNLLF